MPLFSSKSLAKEIRALGANVSIGEPGGDVDTVEITACPKGNGHDSISISGFVTEGDMDPKDEVEVTMVEVTDGQDSRGGLNSDDEDTCILYGRVCSLLRKKGFSVVPSMKDYF